ncbi:hypothetical protein [Myxococcus sp. AB036A]|uniref:hypothetical protein n=1 Tax=Myxococcus sp. AB036A TaxID=2562793 RepID=UPI001891CA2B|nr:hypothetical protein [Myxococcus sp. AB036A]
MTYLRDELWVAGQIQREENGAIGLAFWDGTAWKPLPGGPADGSIYELLLHGDDV